MASPRDRRRDPYADYGREAAKFWDLERLYGDLAVQKGHVKYALGKPAPLTPLECRLLRGLLLGESPQVLAVGLDRKPGGLVVDLSRGLYRYVMGLAGQPDGRMGGWRKIAPLLKRLGYYRGDREGNRAVMVEAAGMGRLPRRFGPGLVGREAELEQVLSLLLMEDGGEGCVAISGAGGVGKTSLATEAAHEWLRRRRAAAGGAGRFAAGRVAFASAKAEHLTGHGALPHLHRCQGMVQLLGAIARQLEVAPEEVGDGSDLEILMGAIDRALVTGPPTLLVLDNLDPLLQEPEQREQVLAFLMDLPRAARAIATARARLVIGGAVRLHPLAAAAAGKLFDRECDRRRVSGLTPVDRRALLDWAGGIPLLLVTAAGRLGLGHGPAMAIAWLRSLRGPAARLCFHEPMADGLPAAAIALVQALSLFEGAILPEEVVQVAGLDPAAAATAEGWQFLVERSWLLGDLGEGAAVALVGSLRSFARDWLVTDPELERQLRDRWHAWGQATATRYGREDRLEWFDVRPLNPYWPSLRAVMDWCLDQGRSADFLNLLHLLKGYLHLSGHWEDLYRWGTALLTLAQGRQDRALEAIAYFERGWTGSLYTEPERLRAAAADLERAWNLQEHGNFYLAAEIATNLGRLWIQLGQGRRAHRYLERAAELLDRRVLDSPAWGRLQVQLLYYNGELAYSQGEYGRAQLFYQDALERSRAIGWQRGIYYCQEWLGKVALAQQDVVQARQCLRDALAVARRQRDQRYCAFCLQTLAQLAAADGDPKEARRLAVRSRSVFQELGMERERATMDGWLRELNGHG